MRMQNRKLYYFLKYHYNLKSIFGRHVPRISEMVELAEKRFGVEPKGTRKYRLERVAELIVDFPLPEKYMDKKKKKKPKKQKKKSNKKFLAKNSFYRTDEWKKLRYETIKKFGARCLACGNGPENGRRINVDHIIPISKDWERRLDPTNLQVLCSDCNWGKGGTDTTDWRKSEEACLTK